MDYLIAVTVADQIRVVQVVKAEDENHARLAAYYHLYGVGIHPSKRVLRKLTKILKSGGISNASY